MFEGVVSWGEQGVKFNTCLTFLVNYSFKHPHQHLLSITVAMTQIISWEMILLSPAISMVVLDWRLSRVQLALTWPIVQGGLVFAGDLAASGRSIFA